MCWQRRAGGILGSINLRKTVEGKDLGRFTKLKHLICRHAKWYRAVIHNHQWFRFDTRQLSQKSLHFWPAERKWEDNYQNKSLCDPFLKYGIYLGHCVKNETKYKALLANYRVHLACACKVADTNLNTATCCAKEYSQDNGSSARSITSHFTNSDFSKGAT